MNIPRINLSQPSFGQVRKSAAKMAIQQANGNIGKLRKIKALVEEQKNNNKFDVIVDGTNYGIAYANSNWSPAMSHENFAVACSVASRLDKECTNAKELALEILAECKKD